MFELPKRIVFAVALFFFIGTIIAVFTVEDILKYGEFSGYKIKLIVPSADGIGIGSPVVLSGVKIGEVSGISLSEDGKKAILTLSIKENVKLAKDVKIQLRMQGVLGNRYVYIKQGESSETLKNGDIIFLESEETEFSKITEGLESVFSDLSETLRSLKNLSDNLNLLIQDIREKGIVDEVKKSVEKGGDMLSEGEKFFLDLQRTVKDIRETINEVRPSISRFSQDLIEISENVKVLSGELREIVNKSGSDAVVDRFLGSGTKNRIQKILSDAENTTPKIKETFEKVDAFISKIGKTAEKVEDLSDFNFSLGAKFEAGTEGKNVLVSQGIFSEFRRKNLFFNLGIQSPPGENRISLNSVLGISSQYFDVGAGFLRSYPSALFGLKPLKLLSLRTEVIGFTEPNLRGLLVGNIEPFSIYTGVENILFPSKRFFLLGVEVKK